MTTSFHSSPSTQDADRHFVHAGLVRSFNRHYAFGRFAANSLLIGSGFALGGTEGMFAAAAIELVNHAVRTDASMSKTMNTAREAFIERHWQSLAHSGFAQTVRQALRPEARLPHFPVTALPAETRLDFSVTAIGTGLRLSSLGALYDFGKKLFPPAANGPR